MNEEKILNQTLQILETDGLKEAYDYLISKQSSFVLLLSQYFNFTSCLAASLEKEEESLLLLEEAIVRNEIWYRKEVFEDSDYDLIRHNPRFLEIQKISKARYHQAKQNTKIETTWNTKKNDNIVLVFHGNQQNNQISQMYWDQLELRNTQIEYIQSNELDSFNLYRWEDTTVHREELYSLIQTILKDGYKDSTLVGFSSGCNAIINLIALGNITCSKIIFYAPWTPFFDDYKNRIIEKLKVNRTQVLLLCGSNDKDAYPHYETMRKLLMEYHIEVTAITVDEMDHELSDSLIVGIEQYINK